jgi:hypothetical protein
VRPPLLLQPTVAALRLLPLLLVVAVIAVTAVVVVVLQQQLRPLLRLLLEVLLRRLPLRQLEEGTFQFFGVIIHRARIMPDT